MTIEKIKNNSYKIEANKKSYEIYQNIKKVYVFIRVSDENKNDFIVFEFKYFKKWFKKEFKKELIAKGKYNEWDNWRCTISD